MKNSNTPGQASFALKEAGCEASFLHGGPYWHLCTPGQSTELLCESEDDYRFSVTVSAIAAAETGVRIITFQVMSNHLHFIMEADEGQCMFFFDSLKRRIRRRMASVRGFVDLSGFVLKFIPVKDLSAIRNEIAYVNRNGYLADSRYTPFSYPWGAGYLYFNPAASTDAAIPFRDMTIRDTLQLCRSRVPVLPETYLVGNHMILPQSFCAIKKGESFFRDAHHYFSAVSKNYEAYSEIAKRLGDDVFLNDDEMFATMTLLCRKNFNESRATMLPIRDKLELARQMRREYNASEGQIQRMLRLDRSIVAELFGR